MKFRRTIIFQIVLFVLSHTAFSQSGEAVSWLTFEQLEDSLAIKPKKVFIDFYADWCSLCLKMQKEVFTDPEIVNKLNEKYYAVQMNVESMDTIFFGNKLYINKRQNKRNPIHQIPMLMAREKTKPFSLPALVFLDENFKATVRYFQYLNVEQLLKILSK